MPPRPIVRYLCRCIDSALFCLIPVIAVCLWGFNRFTLLGVFLPIILEAGCLVRWGQTPGKYFFHTHVSRDNGEGLGWKKALQRTLLVWILGLGCEIPPVGHLAKWLAYKRLKNKGLTLWDRYGGLCVAHSPLHWGKVTLGLTLGLMAGTLQIVFIAWTLFFGPGHEGLKLQRPQLAQAVADQRLAKGL